MNLPWTQLLYRIYERRIGTELQPERLPQHIAVILDGHRRFAQATGLADYTVSYRSGMEKFQEFLGWCRELRIPAVTAWVLSLENLERPTEELEPYLDVLVRLFERLPIEAERLGFSIRFIGSLDILPPRLVAAAKDAEARSPSGECHVTIALG